MCRVQLLPLATRVELKTDGVFLMVALKVEFFTNTQDWQYWYYCQLYILIYLQFSSLFAPSDVSKCEISHWWI